MTRPLPRVLVIDDLAGWNRQYREVLCRELGLVESDTPEATALAVFSPGQRRDGDRIVNDVAVAVEAVARGWRDGNTRWALVLLDLQFDHGAIDEGPLDPNENPAPEADTRFGLEILRALAARWPDPEDPGRTEVPVVALSRRPRSELERELNQFGLLGFRERPESVPDRERLVAGREWMRSRILLHGLTRSTLPNMLGEDLIFLRAVRDARRAASAGGHCLIAGETGAGKEGFAFFLHHVSARTGGPYVPFNSPSIPETLAESYLFGYPPRSGISGANPAGSPGVFGAADGGTVFLDEIADMSALIQPRLLRVLEAGEVFPVNAVSPRKVDVAVIGATNRELTSVREELIARFTSRIVVPPLRHRPTDIPMLFRHFVGRRTAELSDAVVDKEFAANVDAALLDHSWPENVRELRYVGERIAELRRDSRVIQADDVRAAIRPRSALPGAPPPPEQVEGAAPPAAGVRSLLGQLRAAPMGETEVRGVLSEFEGAFGLLCVTALARALELTRDPVSQAIVPTRAIKLLTGKHVSTPEAADVVLRVHRRGAGQQVGAVDEAVSWARGLRHTSTRTGRGQSKQSKRAETSE